MAATAPRPADLSEQRMRRRSPARGRPPAAAREILAAVLVAGLGSAVLQSVIDRLTIPRPSFVPDALASTTVVGLVVVLLLLVPIPRCWPRWGNAAVHLLLSAVTTAVLSFLLHGTRLYLNGLSGDQSFRQYANPLAKFDARRAEIDSWAGSTSARDLLARWDEGSFRPPSVLVLSREDDGLHLGLTADVFPREPNVAHIDVDFGPELFADPAFATREVGPFTLVVRR